MHSFPQPVMSSREVGRDRKGNPSKDNLDSFDLARMERSAQFLSSLLLPLSAAAVVNEDGDGDSAAQVDEADMEVIRDRLTMLLGRKVCMNLNSLLCPVRQPRSLIFSFIVAGPGERNSAQ